MRLKRTARLLHVFYSACITSAFLGNAEVSPKQECESFEDPDSFSRICLAELTVMGGLDTCEAYEKNGHSGACSIALLTCLRYIEARRKCSKESPVPYIPKVVQHWLYAPDTAGILAWYIEPKDVAAEYFGKEGPAFDARP